MPRRVIFEEDDTPNESPPQPQSGEFNPQAHPYTDYNEGAKVKIADIILTPEEPRVKEFTNLPDGMIFDMSLGDVMVAFMRNYANPTFNAAEVLVNTVDKRLRARNGWITKIASILAGEESKQEEINPNEGPRL